MCGISEGRGGVLCVVVMVRHTCTAVNGKMLCMICCQVNCKH